tara:strand:+ start:124092 stop:124931 length:840 start_codon:yes stop_codon:yes gene_type:complete
MAMLSRLIETILTWLLAFTIVPLTFGQQKDFVKLWDAKILGMDKISTDGKENVFITDKQGYLYQYNAKGESINQLATSLSAPLTHLDAFKTVNIFLFSSPLQRFEILDRFLNPIISKSIAEAGVFGWISQASLGNNNSLWVYDESDLNLKKVNLNNNELQQAQAINTIIQDDELEIILLIERYNLLFLQVAGEGIYIFDNQANFIEKISLSANNSAIIDGDFIYAIINDQLVKTNYLTKVSKSIALPTAKTYNRLALSNQQLILANEKGVSVFERPKNF